MHLEAKGKIWPRCVAPYFEDYIFSSHDLPRFKPAPDVYVAATAYLSADPARCLVIQDTATSVNAGLDACATPSGAIARRGMGGRSRACRWRGCFATKMR